MLVLSRKIDEKIYINDDIVLTIVDIRNNDKVRIGIEAPENVVVDREEVHWARKNNPWDGGREHNES